MYNEDYKNAVLGCDSNSGSRLIRSSSPTCDDSKTVTTSESGNGGSNSRSQNKTGSATKENEINSAGDSGENGKDFYKHLC